MTREEFEAVLALENKYRLITEPSTHNGKGGRWVYAALHSRESEDYGYERIWGQHAATMDTAVQMVIARWEKESSNES